MSVLSRVNWVAQQRLDLQDLLMQDSFTAFDFRSIITNFVGTSGTYVVRGLRVIGRTGLTLQIETANSQVFNPLDSNGSFYVGQATDAAISVDLPAGQTNVYIEATFTNQTQAAVNRSFWDPLALTGDTAAGTEFSASTNTQNVIVLSISANTVGFSADAIPLAWASTGASAITSMQDRRPLLYRLGTGGASPDPLHKYAWSTNGKSEPVQSGTAVGDNIGSPWQARDATGSLNDKAFGSFKEWADAMMTSISQITGSAIWYASSLSNSVVSNESLNEIFFDTLGHSPVATTTAAWIWKKSGSSYYLAGEGSASYVSLAGDTGLVQWQANYGKLNWQLGGTFADITHRNYSTLQFGTTTNSSPDDGGNVYLLLERDIPKGSGAAVSWISTGSAVAGLVTANSVSGQAGDFTQIAIGDFIRKESEGYSRYYRVKKLASTTTIYSTGVSASDANMIADSTIVALELEDAILGSASVEPLRYFRARYSNADLVADTNISTYGYQYKDANYYWLGRRSGSLFYLRGYGDLQENEETQVLNEEADGLSGSTGDGGLVLKHAPQAIYDPTAGYSLKTGTGTLLTIYRRARNNTVSTPTDPGDNSGSLLTYTITAPLLQSMTVGQELWVRLSDTTSGSLTSGVVTNATDDTNLTDTVTNQYQVLSAANAPLRTFHNRDVFLLARCLTIGSQTSLLFSDGSVISLFGQLLDENVEVTGSVRIRGNLEVDGHTTAEQVQVLQVDDKVITLGVGNLNLASGGSGLEVADNTQFAATATPYNTSNYIDLTYSTAHGYGTYDYVGVSANVTVGGITAGDIDSTYLIVTSASPTAGQAKVINSTVLRIYTIDTATNSTVVTLNLLGNPPTSIRTFDLKSYFKLSDSSGNMLGSGDLTSWSLKVKQINQIVTVTPVVNYGIIPTANTSEFITTRIPYAAADAQGPGGVNTTLDFSSNFTWTDATSTLAATNIVTTQVTINGESYYANQNSFPATATNEVAVFAQGDVVFQRNEYGEVTNLTQLASNVYNEAVDVVLSPSGNNQMGALLSTPTVVTIPKDTRRYLGATLNVSTVATSNVVTVQKISHGMVTGDTVTVTVTTANSIGGISAANLSVVNAVITNTGTNSFTYVAGGTASSTATGSLDAAYAYTIRKYVVGDRSLQIFLNGVMLRLGYGYDYTEVGATGQLSNQVTFLAPLYVEANSGNVLTYRIEAYGSQVLVSGGSGASVSLQQAYASGNTIAITTGTPVTITGTGKLLHVAGDVQIDGVIDPLGITFTPTASNPLPSGSYGLWFDISGNIIHTRNGQSDLNVTSALQNVIAGTAYLSTSYKNTTGSVIPAYSPISIGTTGTVQVVAVSNEQSSLATIGINTTNINNNASGVIYTHGTVQNITTSAGSGDLIYVSKTGTLTNTKPSIGVGGFLSGDFIVMIGVIAINLSNPSNKDIIINVKVVGQL